MLRENSKVSRILYIILLIIIAGAIIYFSKGLNMSPEYQGVTLMDITGSYIIKIAITTLLITAYYIFRYHKKLEISEIVLYTLLSIVALQLFIVSIFAITRLQIDKTFLPILIFTYVANILFLTNYFEQAKLKDKN